MNIDDIKRAVENGETALGIELGSTRIKAVLINEAHAPIAAGEYEWENRLENGMWTYRLDDAWTGIRSAYAALKNDVAEKYGVKLEKIGAMGVSGMMHGYLPFDRSGNQLAEFRTWRNTVTEREAAELTELFGFNIPQRWSIAHLWRAVQNGEQHTENLDFLTTLAGYVHWQLTGQRVLGIGEASGMFPIDSTTGDYNNVMLEKFDALLKKSGISWTLRAVLPKVLSAGETAGVLTAEGALMLDPTGELAPGVPLCPPEGDAGTGMTATNSVAKHTGNVSAGTSVFAMVVLERALSAVHTEIDMVTTPTGAPVAMVHCNTCTSDLDAWVKLFAQAFSAAGVQITKSELYKLLYTQALSAQPDCDGVLAYNCFSGEPAIGLESGCPLVVRRPDSKLSLPSFMRAQLYSAMAALKIGMDILLKEERVELERLYGHGGLFKTEGVAQQLMADALNVPVAVMETAGEGGPWGMALLAMYSKNRTCGETLESYLSQRLFDCAAGSCLAPNPDGTMGFERYVARYKAALPIEKAAAELI